MLYCVGHMEQDHSDSERGNPLPPAVCALGLVHIYVGGGGGGGGLTCTLGVRYNSLL